MFVVNFPCGAMERLGIGSITASSELHTWVKLPRKSFRKLIGNFGFTHVGRSFDGAQFVRETSAWNLTLMAGRPTRGVFHTDGWGELDTDVAYRSRHVVAAHHQTV